MLDIQTPFCRVYIGSICYVKQCLIGGILFVKEAIIAGSPQIFCNLVKHDFEYWIDFFSLVYKKCICILLKSSKFWHKTFWDSQGSLVWHKAIFLACSATRDEVSSNSWHDLFRKLKRLYCKNRCSFLYLKPRDLIWRCEYFTVKATDYILCWEITQKL